MTLPLISVIVPCYNVEEYLPKCIESILSQTYKNLEILLVDDGSPDNSGRICDEYAGKDCRIRVIHKENGGLSDARNVALDVMKGEYVTFIDSDDYVAEDYVEILYRLIAKYGVQMSVVWHQTFADGTVPPVCHEPVSEHILCGWEALEGMFYQRTFDTAAWAKMYHCSLFSDGVRYPEGWLYEDLPTTYRLIMKCSRIAFGEHRNYFYRIRNTSIEGSPFKPLKYESCLKIVYQLEADSIKMPKQVQRALDCRIVSFAFHILLEIPKEKRYMRESLMKIIKQKRLRVLCDQKARRKARVACWLSVGGIWMVDLFARWGRFRK